MIPESQVPAAEAIEKLTEQARIERTRMSPNTPPTEWADDIRARALEFCRREKTSQTDLARMAGCSATVVSEVLSGKYKGDQDRVLAKLEDILELAATRSRSPGKGHFVSTKVAQEVFAVLKHMAAAETTSSVGRCDDVYEAHIGVLYGPSGIGKSIAIRAAIASEFRHAIYVEVNDHCRVPATLYRALLLALGGRLAQVHYSLPHAFEALVGKLAGTRRIIIIDEAENVRQDALNGLRQLGDATGCPIVLAGRPPIIKQLRRSNINERIGGSLLGRIDIEWDLTARTRKHGGRGGEPLHSQAEIVDMLARFKVRVARDALRWLTGLANVIALSQLAQEREGCGLRYAIRLFTWTVSANPDKDIIEKDDLLEINALKQGEEYASMIVEEVETYMAATA